MKKNLSNSISAVKKNARTKTCLLKNDYFTLNTTNMRNVFFVLFVAIMATFTSCTDSFVGQRFDNTLATARSSNELEVAILTSNGTTINVNTDVVQVSNVNGYIFTVAVNGTNYTALNVTVVSDADAMRVTRNPGANQVVYDERSTVAVRVVNGALNIDIDAGSVITTGASVVIEESEAL